MNYKNIAELVKHRIPEIKPVMEFYGIQFNRNGFAVCPFHKEKTASLSTKSNFFKCFGCGAGGDVITFVQKYHSESFVNAVKRLNQDFHLGLGADKPESTTAILQRRREQDRKKREQEQFEQLYSRVCEEHRRLHLAYIHDAPRAGEPIRESYAEACRRLPYLEWWLDAHPFHE